MNKHKLFSGTHIIMRFIRCKVSYKHSYTILFLKQVQVKQPLAEIDLHFKLFCLPLRYKHKFELN